MIKLFDKEIGADLGFISEEQLKFLADQLEEESPDDTDYYFNSATIDLLAERGADEELLAKLRQALGSKEGVEIRWEREE